MSDRTFAFSAHVVTRYDQVSTCTGGHFDFMQMTHNYFRRLDFLGLSGYSKEKHRAKNLYLQLILRHFSIFLTYHAYGLTMHLGQDVKRSTVKPQIGRKMCGINAMCEYL